MPTCLPPPPGVEQAASPAGTICARMLGVLLATLVAGGADGGIVPCPRAHQRYIGFADGERLFAQVRVGWTTARLRALLGDPHSCQGATWSYSAGSPDGPLLDYHFRIKAGTVVYIEHAAAACIYRERVD